MCCHYGVVSVDWWGKNGFIYFNIKLQYNEKLKGLWILSVSTVDIINTKHVFVLQLHLFQCGNCRWNISEHLQGWSQQVCESVVVGTISISWMNEQPFQLKLKQQLHHLHIVQLKTKLFSFLFYSLGICSYVLNSAGIGFNSCDRISTTTGKKINQVLNIMAKTLLPPWSHLKDDLSTDISVPKPQCYIICDENWFGKVEVGVPVKQLHHLNPNVQPSVSQKHQMFWWKVFLISSFSWSCVGVIIHCWNTGWKSEFDGDVAHTVSKRNRISPPSHTWLFLIMIVVIAY